MNLEQNNNLNPEVLASWYSFALSMEDRWSWNFALGAITRQNQLEASVFDCSDERIEDFAGLVNKLELSRDIELACTVIGGAMYNDTHWEMIMKMYFCSFFFHLTSMLKEHDDSAVNKRLLVIASGIEGGVLGSVGEARLYVQSIDHIRENRVQGDFELVGVAPRGRVVRIDRGDGGPDPLDLKIELLKAQMGISPSRSLSSFAQVDAGSPTFQEYVVEQLMVKFGERIHGMSAIESPHPSRVVYTGNRYPDEGNMGEWRTMNDAICGISEQFTKRVTLVVNGGAGAAYELSKIVKSRGRIIVLKGSQRFADAIASWVEGTTETLSDEQRQDLGVFLLAIEGKEDEVRSRIEVYDMFAKDSLTGSAHGLAGFVAGRNK